MPTIQQKLAGQRKKTKKAPAKKTRSKAPAKKAPAKKAPAKKKSFKSHYERAGLYNPKNKKNKSI